MLSPLVLGTKVTKTKDSNHSPSSVFQVPLFQFLIRPNFVPGSDFEQSDLSCSTIRPQLRRGSLNLWPLQLCSRPDGFDRRRKLELPTGRQFEMCRDRAERDFERVFGLVSDGSTGRKKNPPRLKIYKKFS